MKFNLVLLLTLICFSVNAQPAISPCSNEAIIQRHLETNPNYEEEMIETEKELQKLITHFRANPNIKKQTTYVIPVVMHVFHSGDDGKMGMEQALSGLEIMNNDFNGLNDGWDTIDPEFDPIKGTLDITFCLATIDPEGNPTTGVLYYDDPDLMLNNGDMTPYSWDNFSYLNIYFPKYTNGAPSLFTAYAYFPSYTNSLSGGDGIWYSSIRWGYGEHSELEPEDDWASVSSHEAGHWLDLFHTFTNSCGGSDLVGDTPPSLLLDGIQLEGCNNNDFSCGVHTNGENFMDYNHRCKKMFTAGQAERMTAALSLNSRAPIWSAENLVETGCSDLISSTDDIANHSISIFPNPTSHFINITNQTIPSHFEIYNGTGKLVQQFRLTTGDDQIDVSALPSGIYFYALTNDKHRWSGRFVKE